MWSDSIWPQLRRTLAWPAILIGAGFAASVVIALRRGMSVRDRPLILAGAIAASLLLLAYLATPYSAGGPEGFPFLVAADARYAAPALLVAAVLAGGCLGAVGWLAAIFAIAAPVAFLDGARWSLGAYTDAGGTQSARLGRGRSRPASAVGIGWSPGGLARARPRRPLAVAGVAAGLAIALGVGGYAIQKRFNENRFADADPTTDWIRANAPSGSRIGLAAVWDDVGISPVLPAFGPRYGNEVSYIGEWDDDMLRRFHDRAPFVEALERGGFDLVLIGKGRYEAPLVPEQDWARDAGFTTVAESDRLTLLAPPAP